MPWDPDRYHQFQRERSAPFDDLLTLVRRRDGLSVIDLGCGSGELTARLADILPGSDVVGLDSSPQMLARAEKLTRPGLRFERGDLAQVDGDYDLVFSNAAIQWVPDHRRLFPRLLSLVRLGGQLVAQIPSNFDHISHRLLEETSAEEPFRMVRAGWEPLREVLPLEEYAEIFYDQGFTDMTVLAKIYPHVLPDADAIVEWMRGTALVPYMERLPEDLHSRFLAAYRDRLRAALPQRPVFYGFRRFLFAVSRP